MCLLLNETQASGMAEAVWSFTTEVTEVSHEGMISCAVKSVESIDIHKEVTSCVV